MDLALKQSLVYLEACDIAYDRAELELRTAEKLHVLEDRQREVDAYGITDFDGLAMYYEAAESAGSAQVAQRKNLLQKAWAAILNFVRKIRDAISNAVLKSTRQSVDENEEVEVPHGFKKLVSDVKDFAPKLKGVFKAAGSVAAFAAFLALAVRILKWFGDKAQKSVENKRTRDVVQNGTPKLKGAYSERMVGREVFKQAEVLQQATSDIENVIAANTDKFPAEWLYRDSTTSEFKVDEKKMDPSKFKSDKEFKRASEAANKYAAARNAKTDLDAATVALIDTWNSLSESAQLDVVDKYDRGGAVRIIASAIIKKLASLVKSIPGWFKRKIKGEDK